MPITYRIDVPDRLIRTTCYGHVTLEEIHAHFDELRGAWPPVAKLDVLLDLTCYTSIPQIWELREAASRIGMFGGRERFRRCAIIAHRELLYGLLRVFELFVDRNFVAVRVFRNEHDAMDWLRKRPLAKAG